jgi:hypothetical protein
MKLLSRFPLTVLFSASSEESGGDYVTKGFPIGIGKE